MRQTQGSAAAATQLEVSFSRIFHRERLTKINHVSHVSQLILQHNPTF
jgi:hypothetical protein